ncbi:ribonuclease H-like domain-containing protein [Tanacetum coccineum]
MVQNLRTEILLNFWGQKGSRGNTVMPENSTQQNRVAEKVSTACYVLNRVLVTKPHNKTPYELITGKIPIISYIRLFGCHVTILNTIDHLGKFVGKSNEGFLVGYSLQSKAFRVYNLETKRVEENLHITFLENKPNVAGKGPTWLFDLDYLTDSMNYQPVRSENQANKHAGPQEANQNAGTEDIIDAGDSEKEAESAQDYFVLPIWSSYSSTVKRSTAKDAGEAPNKHPDLKTDEKPIDKEDQVFLDELERLKRQEQDANDAAEALRKEFAQETEDLLLQAGAAKTSSTNIVNTASTPVSTASPYGGLSFTDPTNPDQDDSEIPLILEGKKFIIIKLMGRTSSNSRFRKFRILGRTLWKKFVLVLGKCKKQTIVATSTTEAEYVAAANCCGQVLWIQNQMLDYGFNFINTKIYIDNESTICIVKNPVFHSKTKHIAIRHHFIRDAYEKKLIQVLKIHTDDNVADLLTKAFDVSSYLGYKESLQRDIDGTKALLLPNLLKSCLAKVSTDSAIFVPMGKGKHFSGKVTPLFPNMLVQPTEDEGEGSERPYEPQPTPSPPHPSEAHVEPQSEPSHLTSPPLYLFLIPFLRVLVEILEAQVKRLKKQVRPFILHHKAWLRIVKRKNQNKKKVLKTLKRRSVFKQGRKTIKSSKGAPTVPTNTEWDDLDMDIDDTIKYTLAQDEGKTDKIDEKGESTTQQQSTDRQVEVQLKHLKEKEKGVEIRNAERPRTTSTRSVLTLKPLPKIDPNDKGKKRIKEDEESDTESEEISEAKKSLIRLLMMKRVQKQERTVQHSGERAKFLHDTIATQRRILAQQRSEAIQNKPPTKNQFRNQMMTYLKHVGNKKHADLKTKSFDEIKALYEKVKRFDDSFITIGSTEDERKIKEMNEGASDPDKKKKIVKEDVSAKVPAKQDVAEQGTKKRKEGDYLVVYRVNGTFRAFNYLIEVLHIFDRQDLFHLYDLVMKQYSESTPEGIELILWGDLKIMMESSIEVTDQGDF